MTDWRSQRDRALFAKLRTADPQTGAKPVIRAHTSADGDVEVEDPGAFWDVDTPAEYEQLRNSRRT